MEPRHIYTSTGLKLWRHPEQLISYLHGTGKSVISTHISPTSKCNLNCSYCSVSKREQHEEIDLNTIYNYISELRYRGLKGVIFTGGGEPTQYPHWNRLMGWLRAVKFDHGIKFGLITNGVDLVKKDLGIFDWIRISLNHGQEKKIVLNSTVPSNCTIGLSLVYAGMNKAYSIDHLLNLIQKYNAEYLRILPDCKPENLKEAHKEIDKFIDDPSHDTHQIIHQEKYHRRPMTQACHQAYFRPYLSEIAGGTVFPCDSVVLNGSPGKFEDKYAICKAAEVGDFLDGKIKLPFDATEDCPGCVFTDNVEAIQRWTAGYHEFNKAPGPIKHEEFL